MVMKACRISVNTMVFISSLFAVIFYCAVYAEAATCGCRKAIGCVISRPAPSGSACKCIRKYHWVGRGLTAKWTYYCTAQVVRCRNGPNNWHCRHPSTSIHSCFQGSASCYGPAYGHTCDCTYKMKFMRKGGCYINKAPPQWLACKCEYGPLWKCGGKIIRCRDENSYYCKHPSKSKQTCQFGGGDCWGY